MKRKRALQALLIVMILALTAGCGAAQSPSPQAEERQFIACEYLGYYMSGWELEYNGGVIRADEPLGTGSEMVNAYIKPNGEDERLLTHYMGAYTGAYLSGDWLYFSYADTDNGVYDTCRVNIKTLDEPEFLGDWLRFATDDFIYYCKNDDFTKIYRRNTNFENEALTFANVDYLTSFYPAGDRIVYADENAVIVYNQQGEKLFSTEADIGTLWNYYIYNGAFYWFESADTPDEPVRIHCIDTHTGEVTSLAETYIDIEGFPCGIPDIDELGVYLKINVPFPENYEGEEPFPNTKFYLIPHTGGSAELVKEWFES